MKQLFLEDLAGLTEDEVKAHIKDSYAYNGDLSKYKILIAYESVGSWGCDSSSWFLLLDIYSGKLYETHGSHCSCYGFEDQFNPEETTLEYLKSDKFYLSTGGYDNDSDTNKVLVRKFLQAM